MPVWDKALFDQTYDAIAWAHGMRGSTRVPHHAYHWWCQKDRYQRLANLYLSLPGFAQVSDVAFIGSAYGWAAEILQANGINAVSVDTSPHVLATKDTSEEGELRDILTSQGFDPDFPGVAFMSPDDPNVEVANVWSYWLRSDGVRTSVPVLDQDLSTNSSRRDVRQALGNNIDAIVTEHALDSQDTENDSLILVERCEQLRPNPATNVIHLIGPSVYVNKTGQEWKDLIVANGYNHTVVDIDGLIY